MGTTLKYLTNYVFFSIVVPVAIEKGFNLYEEHKQNKLKLKELEEIDQVINIKNQEIVELKKRISDLENCDEIEAEFEEE